jgi:hypothetical protein
MPSKKPHHVPDPGADPQDLAERLARYRSRVAREGRKTALDRLDRAIDEAKRTTGPQE